MITSEAKSSETMRSWKNHVQGATSLLELRGEEQLNSESGLEMFTLVRLQNVGRLCSDLASWRLIHYLYRQ